MKQFSFCPLLLAWQTPVNMLTNDLPININKLKNLKIQNSTLHITLFQKSTNHNDLIKSAIAATHYSNCTFLSNSFPLLTASFCKLSRFLFLFTSFNLSLFLLSLSSSCCIDHNVILLTLTWKWFLQY